MPAAARFEHFRKDDMHPAKELAAWKANLHQYWPGVKFLSVKAQRILIAAKQASNAVPYDSEAEVVDTLRVGEPLQVTAAIDLGKLQPDDVTVELYLGTIDADESITNPEIIRMTPAGNNGAGVFEFVTTIKNNTSGRLGYTVRLLPRHNELDQPLSHGLILWAQ
jgi:starch phosphorylase